MFVQGIRNKHVSLFHPSSAEAIIDFDNAEVIRGMRAGMPQIPLRVSSGITEGYRRIHDYILRKARISFCICIDPWFQNYFS